MTPRGNTRLKIWLTIVSVFVLGCVPGASLDAYSFRLAITCVERTTRGMVKTTALKK